MEKHQSKVEIVLPELDAMKSITWNFHVDDSQGNYKYNMILGSDILSKLQIYLFLFNSKIGVNEGTYKAFSNPMKDVMNITTSARAHDNNFWNKELWER